MESVPDLRSIARLAHEHGMLCLADEAHGTHFYFGEGLPVSAMAAGADMAAISMHKSGGSSTQSSLLLTGPAMSTGYVETDYQPDPDHQRLLPSFVQSGYFQKESGLGKGKEAFGKVTELAGYARNEINKIGGYYAYSRNWSMETASLISM